MLEIEDLHVIFDLKKKPTYAVNGINFTVPKGSIVGIVGESGSGKSVTALSIINLLPENGSITKGRLLWNGDNLLKKSKKEWSTFRGSEIGLIFQNPLAALNPVYTIGNQMIETIKYHQNVSTHEAKKIAIDLLQKVSISCPEERLKQYPHEFSLGMCQRIMIAITLAMKPKLLIADEPTASLDVTIQSQILRLLEKLQKDLGLSILLISHDLGVIAQHCNIIQVMYLGKIVESGTPEEIFHSPKHPYTQALLSAIPNVDPRVKTPPLILPGEIPSPKELPKGCSFHTRCPHVMEKCRKKYPNSIHTKSQSVACFLYHTI